MIFRARARVLYPDFATLKKTKTNGLDRMSYTIRTMTSDDLDKVYDIELAAHRAPWGRYILSDCLLVGYDFRVLEIPKKSQKEIIGYVISRNQNSTCHVLNLCVAPAFQGNEYGRILLENLMGALRGTPVNTLFLEVRPSNLSALRLYQKMGFEHVALKPAYYNDQHGVEDAVVLQKKISIHSG